MHIFTHICSTSMTRKWECVYCAHTRITDSLTRKCTYRVHRCTGKRICWGFHESITALLYHCKTFLNIKVRRVITLCIEPLSSCWGPRLTKQCCEKSFTIKLLDTFTTSYKIFHPACVSIIFSSHNVVVLTRHARSSQAQVCKYIDTGK